MSKILQTSELFHLVFRRRLQNITQGEEETAEQFANRINEMTIGGFPYTTEKDRQKLAVHSFLKGCNNEQAALSVLEEDPPTLHLALRYLKLRVLTNQALAEIKDLFHRKIDKSLDQISTECTSEQEDNSLLREKSKNKIWNWDQN